MLGVLVNWPPHEEGNAMTTEHIDDSTVTVPPSRGYSGTKEDYHKRLRRIEGQVRGIARMVEEDTYCIDILTQVSAVTKALHAVSLGLLEDHIGHCVVNAAQSSPTEGQEKVAVAAAAIARLVRS